MCLSLGIPTRCGKGMEKGQTDRHTCRKSVVALCLNLDPQRVCCVWGRASYAPEEISVGNSLSL